MSDEVERELREHFQRLREEEARAAPDFRAILDRPVRVVPPRRPGARLLWVVLAAAVLAVVAIGLARLRHPRPAFEVDLSLTTWRGPTDFLLVFPNSETLRTVPRLGELDLNWRTP